MEAFVYSETLFDVIAKNSSTIEYWFLTNIFALGESYRQEEL